MAIPMQGNTMISAPLQSGSNISLQLFRHQTLTRVPGLPHEVDLNDEPPVQGAVAVRTNAQAVLVGENETLGRAHHEPAGIHLQVGTIDAITAAPIPIEEMHATSSNI